MKQIILVTVAVVLICATTAVSGPWGEEYFPNVPLITQDGEHVRFFDDLIKDKVVLINFIYTRCPDTCPLETAQLVNVQKILGDRVGKDVFFYSISIDPRNDTPSVLKEYKEMFHAHWTFLTGEESDIIKLRKKLGLFIPEIQDRSYNHNVNMIIGNQATGRWMKSSPFENPYILADKIGNWLPGWKLPPEGDDYSNAPKLRKITPGEQLYRTRCTSCHSLIGHDNKDALGPDLLGVVQRRDMNWILKWLKAPDQVLKAKDPIAMELYKQYDKLAMPNLRLNKQEAVDLIAYIDEESQRVLDKEKKAADKLEHGDHATYAASESTFSHAKPDNDVMTIMNAWVREAHLGAKMNAGYMTLVNTGPEDVTLVKVESDAFKEIEIHEMAMVDGLMSMRELANLVVSANGQVQLKPGGMHLMLIGPRNRLTTGQQVDMTLTFKSGIKQKISVGVFATEASAKYLPSKKSSSVEVVFETTMGPFEVKLDPEKAPKTVTNFLSYVDDGFYNNTLFHRIVPEFVVQGGGLKKGMVKKQTHPPVENESHNGLGNSRGTITMARKRSPHSASSQFFINVADNPSLDFRNNRPGYTVFGKVTKGMDIIDKMTAVPTESFGGYKNVPKDDIFILSAKRKELTVAQVKKDIEHKANETPVLPGREQIMAVISYLQTIGEEVDIATIDKVKNIVPEQSEGKRTSFVPPIDVGPDLGEKIFFDDTREGACSKCHMVGDKGNKVGPDLTGVGAVLTPQYLMESILKPSDVIMKGFETMYLITTDGIAYNGVVQSQTDKEIILLVDEESGIAEYTFHPDEIEKMQKQDISSMPGNFSETLSTREFYGIVSYLLSLKE